MLRSILQITGIEQKLQAIKDRVDGEAQNMWRQSRAVAIQIGLVMAMSTIAVIFSLMAVVAGLASLYFWLAPHVGPAAAMAMIAGGLLVLAGGFVIAAVTASKKVSTVIAENESKMVPKTVRAPRPLAERTPLVEPPRRPVTASEVDSLFAVAGQFARLPRTGIEPVDNMIRALAPQAEDATREAVARAANLVRHGERTTVLAILGSAVVLGWAITKVDRLPGLIPIAQS